MRSTPRPGRSGDRMHVQVAGNFEVRLLRMAVAAGKRNGEKREQLKLIIRKAFDDSDGTYGHRRVWAQLARWGVRAGPSWFVP